MSSSNFVRIVVGVDPGTIVTGYAIIGCTAQGTIEPLDFGCIKPPKKGLLSARYHILYQSLCHLITTYAATEMAIETPFVSKNIQSALKLGSAVGCAIIAAKEHGMSVYPYAPCVVKKSITGAGGATKEEVQNVLKLLLRLKCASLEADATDALAIAIHHVKMPQPLKEM